MNKYLLLTTLLCSLVLHSAALSLSGRKQYNPLDYANALIDEQNQFDSKVAEVQSEIGIVNNILNNSTITSKVKLVLVSEGMADERNTLLDMQQILKLPFELRQCRCANLDKENRALVNQKIDNISGLITNLRQSLKKCDQSRCPRYEEIALELSQS